MFPYQNFCKYWPLDILICMLDILGRTNNTLSVGKNFFLIGQERSELTGEAFHGW